MHQHKSHIVHNAQQTRISNFYLLSEEEEDIKLSLDLTKSKTINFRIFFLGMNSETSSI